MHSTDATGRRGAHATRWVGNRSLRSLTLGHGLFECHDEILLIRKYPSCASQVARCLKDELSLKFNKGHSFA